jgi:hypothetical protein
MNNASKEKNLYIKVFYDLGFHANWKDVNGNKMLSAPEEVLMAYLEMMKELPIYNTISLDKKIPVINLKFTIGLNKNVTIKCNN